MIQAEIDSRLKRAKSAIDAISQASPDPYISTLLYRYICVLLSGNIERCIHLILSEYAKRHSDARMQKYISSRFERGTNYQAQRIIETLSGFDPAWGKEFDDFCKLKERKDRLDSIYRLRITIAHGNDVDVRPETARQYYEVHAEVIRFIASLVL